MTQTIKYILQVFGVTLFAVFLAMLFWSLSQPLMTESPMSPMPAQHNDTRN